MSKALLRYVSFIILGFTINPAGAQEGANASTNTPTVSGYINIQYAFDHGQLPLSSSYRVPGPVSGFLVHQGTFMITHETENVEFLLDIPYRRASFLNGTFSPDPSRDNEIELGTQEAQAMLKWSTTSGLSFQAGQFDSPFGLEANDTKDIFFARHGIMRDMRPRTHTGVQIDYARLPFVLQMIIANAGEGGRQQSGRSPSLGLRAIWSEGQGSIGLGLLAEDVYGSYALDASDISYRPRILANLVGEIELNNFFISVEGSVIQSEFSKTKNLESSLAQVNHDMVMGFLVQVVRPVTEKIKAGLRYEYTKNDERNPYVRFVDNQMGTNSQVGQGGFLSKMTLGARYDLNEDVQLRGDLNFNTVDVGVDVPGTQVGFTTGTLAMVYSF